jgi:hypothetical protein
MMQLTHTYVIPTSGRNAQGEGERVAFASAFMNTDRGSIKVKAYTLLK